LETANQVDEMANPNQIAKTTTAFAKMENPI
jgi:hypothetical protein